MSEIFIKLYEIVALFKMCLICGVLKNMKFRFLFLYLCVTTFTRSNFFTVFTGPFNESCLGEGLLWLLGSSCIEKKIPCVR